MPVSPVRAGTIPGWKYIAYVVVVLAEVVGVTIATAAGTNPDRIVTGIVLGVTLGVPLGWLLRRSDAVILTDESIVLTSFIRRRRMSWNRVVGGRFAFDERGRWTLALDLTPGTERHNELVLLTIPPVSKPPASPYDMHKREQIIDIRAVLSAHRIPITIVPEIATCLNVYWHIGKPRMNKVADPLDEDY